MLIYFIFCFIFNFARFLLFFVEPWHFNIDLVRADLIVCLFLLIHCFSFITNTSEIVTIAAVWIFHFFISIFNLEACIQNFICKALLLFIEIDSFLKWLLFVSLLSEWRTIAIILFLLIKYLLFWGYLDSFPSVFSTLCNYSCWFMNGAFSKKNCIFRIVLNI